MASQLIANLEACASRDDLGDICQAIEEAPSFDQLALAQLAIASGEAEVTAAALGRIESRLGAALGAHVAARYSELITEVDAVRSLEARLVQSHSRVERLAATVRRVRTTTVGQHEQLSGRVSQLEHMQECSSLLRRVQRLLYLCWRLHEAVDASKARRSAGGGAGSGAWRIELSSAELPKAAVALREVEEILEEEEERLDGVELVAPELQFARSVGAAVRRQADGMLREALRSLNQPSLTTALQVFFSLGCLRDKVEEAVAAAAASLGTDVSDALTNIDARAARGGRAGWVAALWGQVEAVGELLLGAATRLCLLTRVLSKRRDPLTHTLFASLLTGQGADPRAGEEDSSPAAAPAGGGDGGDGGGGGGGVGGLEAALREAWPEADLRLIGSDPLLGPLLRGADASAPRAAPLASPMAPASAQPPAGLRALWRPLAVSACGSLCSACDRSSSLRSVLVAELPRLVTALLSSLGRLPETAATAAIPPDAAAELGADALLRLLRPLAEPYQQESTASLFEASDGFAAALQRLAAAGTARLGGGLGGGGPGGGEANGEGGGGGTPEQPRVGTPGGGGGGAVNSDAAVEAGAVLRRRAIGALRRSAPVRTLQLGVVQGLAQAIRMLAAKLELMLAERPAAEAGSRAWAASEAANGATLTVLKALREDLVAEMSGMAEAAAAPLRVAVGGLAPVVTTLANPATPLPDALREAGAKVLKQLLRSGMIEEG